MDCQSGISRVLGDRQLALPDCSSCIVESLANVIFLKIRIGGENFLVGHAISHHTDDSKYRHSESTDARQPAHLTRIDGYTGEGFDSSLHMGRFCQYKPESSPKTD